MQEATQELDFAAPEIQHPRCAESLQRLDHQAATTLMRPAFRDRGVRRITSRCLDLDSSRLEYNMSIK
jgi:hypothetical protein